MKNKKDKQRENGRREYAALFSSISWGPFLLWHPCSPYTSIRSPTVTVPYQSPPLASPHPRFVEARSIEGEGWRRPPPFRSDPPYHGYSISFHYAPCSTNHPTTHSLSRCLSLSHPFSSPVVLLTAPSSSRYSYHGDETRTLTNFYCYFSRRFVWPPPSIHPSTFIHPSIQRLLLSLFLCAF